MITEKLYTDDIIVKSISLICNENTLRTRLKKDIESGIRTADVLDRSLAKLEKYHSLNTIKIYTDGKTINEIADEIVEL